MNFLHSLAALLVGTSSMSAAEAGTRREEAVFAGGCFWCTEFDMDKVPGVLSTTSGFAGGHTRNPSYEQVSAGGTGHREAVKVVFDPDRISYEALVERFFRTIDPLDRGGQFCDRGPEYRTAIFAAGAAQRKSATAVKARLQRGMEGSIATDILAASPFYAAGPEHQDYHRKNPLKYRFYRLTCGRDARITQVWGNFPGR